VLPSDRRTDGRWRLGGTRGETTPVGPRVAARRYSDTEREASSACAQGHGEGVASEGGPQVARAHGNRGNGAARAGAAWCGRDTTCRTGDV
jgi:hypothetical protein